MVTDASGPLTIVGTQASTRLNLSTLGNQQSAVTLDGITSVTDADRTGTMDLVDGQGPLVVTGSGSASLDIAMGFGSGALSIMSFASATVDDTKPSGTVSVTVGALPALTLQGSATDTVDLQLNGPTTVTVDGVGTVVETGSGAMVSTVHAAAGHATIVGTAGSTIHLSTAGNAAATTVRGFSNVVSTDQHGTLDLVGRAATGGTAVSGAGTEALHLQAQGGTFSLSGFGSDTVDLGAARSSITIGSAGPAFITGGSGAYAVDDSKITGGTAFAFGTGSGTVAGGSGVDSYSLSSANLMAGAVQTITDFAAHDLLTVSASLRGETTVDQTAGGSTIHVGGESIVLAGYHGFTVADIHFGH